MGDGNKIIEKNELDSSVIQRRSIRSRYNLKKGTVIKKKHLVYLRPCPPSGLNPFEENKIILKNLKKEYI